MTTEKTTSTSESLLTTAGPEDTCQVYRGQVCDTWLNVTMLEYRWTPRFIDNRMRLNGTEQVIIEFMYSVNQIDGQERCKRILKALLCEYILPPCNENNEPYRYCREDCEALFDECNSAIREMLGVTKYIHKKLGYQFAHAGVPNCTKLSYSADSKAENTTCIHFGLFSFTTAEPSAYNRDSENRINSTTIILSIIGVFILFCIGIVVRFHRRRVSAKRDDVTHEAAENWALEGTAFSWEIPSQQIDLQSVLGSGTFGEVWKAVIWALNGIPGQTIAAVKKLKHNSSQSEKESLAQEIELGRSLKGDRHPNIVNFLGCVSTSEAPLMLVLEYAPYGDLLGYLRKSRGLEDKYYCYSESCPEEVTSYDLLSFAQQIASGMSFLASKKILHRDLAARNILVGVDRTCKITDFGLALVREKHQYLYCTAIRKGRLPIKWTAPEHLFNDADENNVRVSEKSDVWSYGIVLYEIFTLGGLPYPGWGEWKVVYELKVNKYRMDQPDHVSDELYRIMVDCWLENPDDRPSFELLHEETTGLLQEEHYLDLDMSKYEAHLYTDVEELDAVMGHEHSLETRGPSEEIDTTPAEH
ncbi:proto-oncogene tyrosine-protein kinase receptor Ret-like isoform X2 [Oculina patagonica]